MEEPQQVLMARMSASSMNKFGYEITPCALAQRLANINQVYIQKAGMRPLSVWIIWAHYRHILH
jgi:20S proteasome subunit alpha 1